jgi:hypothetical protein
MSVYMSVYMSVFMSVYISICLSICLYVDLPRLVVLYDGQQLRCVDGVKRYEE